MERAQGLKLKPYNKSSLVAGVPAGNPSPSPAAGVLTGSSYQTTLIIIIILFHLVGLIGLSIPSSRPLFLKLVPWHLLLMLIVVIISHKPLNARILWFGLIIFISAFTAEWIGIHKNWLFGNYAYGPTLGFKLDAVPLIIGINWFLLIYSTGVLMQHGRIKNVIIRVIAGALILVLLDMLIEPVAARFDYWHWGGNIIPYKNYVCWFAVTALMLLIFEKFNFKKQSIVAPVFLAAQFLFFMILLSL